jgi:hypothetical protein
MGPRPAKVAFGVTHIGLWQPPCIGETCYFRAQKVTRKVPMFGDAYRCVCLLIFEIWCYTMRGSWFRSVSTWGVQEGLIWSISNSILLLLSCCSIDRHERLGQTPFGSRWSVSLEVQVFHDLVEFLDFVILPFRWLDSDRLVYLAWWANRSCWCCRGCGFSCWRTQIYPILDANRASRADMKVETPDRQIHLLI